MSRDNGSIIGMPNAPTKAAASGIWTTEAAYIATKDDSWPITLPPLPPLAYRSDPFSASLFAAITFESVGTVALTGGAYNNVAAEVRAASGQTPGTATALSNQGNGIFTFTGADFLNRRYTNSWTLQSASSTSHLTYWDRSQDLTSNFTIEYWVYFPVGSTQNLSTFANNSFSGGFYNGVSAYLNGAAANPANTMGFFTNQGTSTQSAASQWSTGEWFHIAYVFRASQTELLFLNGTLLTSNGVGAGGGNKLAIGGTYWDGLGSAANRSGIQIMDLRIYTAAKYTTSFTIDIEDTTKGGSITT